MKDRYEKQDMPTFEKIVAKCNGVKGKDNLTLLDYAAHFENLTLVKLLLERAHPPAVTIDNLSYHRPTQYLTGHSRIIQMLQDSEIEKNSN